MKVVYKDVKDRYKGQREAGSTPYRHAGLPKGRPPPAQPLAKTAPGDFALAPTACSGELSIRSGPVRPGQARSARPVRPGRSGQAVVVSSGWPAAFTTPPTASHEASAPPAASAAGGRWAAGPRGRDMGPGSGSQMSPRRPIRQRRRPKSRATSPEPGLSRRHSTPAQSGESAWGVTRMQPRHVTRSYDSERGARSRRGSDWVGQ